MKRDLLSAAAQALRETEEASELEARSTRARVMTGLHQTTIRRRTRLVFLLPIAATFVGVTAWASVNDNAHRALQTLAAWVSPAPTPVNVPVPVNVNVSVSVHDAPSSAAVNDAPTSALTPALSVPAPASSASSGSPPPLNVPVPVHGLPSSSSSPHINDPTLILYRAAHTAHFVDHDPARALVGWDAYLAAAPNGPFAPEARYNRALSLVRLGRNSEAIPALEPFAKGAYNGYRQAEASALLQRLEQ